MNDNRTAWGQADKWCWGEKPVSIHPVLAPLVNTLYELRAPVEGLQSQLIHGDLNPSNILIAPDQPPAFLDLSPFWGLVEFALGMYANWVGPRQGDSAVVRHLRHVRAFDQMLIRASIRMSLVMQVGGRVEYLDTCSEKKAAELVVTYVEEKKT
jgi:hypothetical protein